ncbi:MAG: class I SAM-dependent methyltransferase [Anaerolineales bacterium]
MVRQRIPETGDGIQGESIVADYDEMQRSLRDRGWIETKLLLDHGLLRGHALEVGPGPGYLGLEWLKHTTGTKLTGLDISPDMQALAKRNAQSYGIANRTDYRLGSGDGLPFPDASFDFVFTNGSLHEWANPKGTFDEIGRVLAPGGRYLISDLRRDLNPLAFAILWLGCRPGSMRSGLISSINAAYTASELPNLLAGTRLAGAKVESQFIGNLIYGVK